ncbi:hypothetical protein C6Y11_06500 [Lactiplantibacillus pentosus]|nr:hypothetical protein [Lactiplantibacillus pentosus]PRO79933.1 hypothetical protein C6Y11_06500 [Lactiplantibacillus pentosus]PRO82698.1 hypothetical protein C6Y09_02070 [Lactiplantibacillus pentosus]PRO93305.1 hypothetical protein C6Y12_02950 [Lactiplantibacillus pentosus]
MCTFNSESKNSFRVGYVNLAYLKSAMSISNAKWRNKQIKCIVCHKMLFLAKIKLKKQHIGIIIANENQHIKLLGRIANINK